MEFKKNQRVTGRLPGGQSQYRLESGPFRNRSGEFWVVERLDGPYAGDYTTMTQENIRPVPPGKGDKGHITSVSGGRHPYTPHEWVYGDDKVILLKDRVGDYETFARGERQRVLDSWEPVE